ncbi:hypothetical protein CHS0354_035192 [Potamilus streckersoni]|uniref:2-hydroxyacyl-CoA lyase 2 n=1 Tax=Potamilus streckersoni TaxID=2493646 RepID=A0AAE0VNH6_9BIVA|nr:hypothetical protein CHS0354_035192 [Potamilus streckersoni]
MKNNTSFDTNKPLDLICLGRAGVDIYASQIGAKLEDVTLFNKYLGGSSANIAFGTARLGLKSSMLTRVGDEHMGRFIRQSLAAEGCDVSHVVTDRERLTALVLLGIKDQETFPLIFYRENCADMAVSKTDFDEAYIASAKTLLITGTHFSTGQTKSVSTLAADYARRNNTRTVLDIDYRPVLWGLTGKGDGESRFISSDTVTTHLQSVVPLFDLIVGTEEEFYIAGGSQDIITALKNLRAICPSTVFAVKRGPYGCTVFDSKIPENISQGFSVKGVQVEVLNVLGAGDAFMSGFLKGWINGEDYERCCTYANACGALVVSRHACSPSMPTLPELDYYLKTAHAVAYPDKDETLNRLHRKTRPHREFNELCIFAFDHRTQIADMQKQAEAEHISISDIKMLMGKAFLACAGQMDKSLSAGVLVDDVYGQKALNALTGKGFWIARPVELPLSRPIEFQGSGSIGSQLMSWPAEHIVKCLIYYHPDDDIAVRDAQEKKIAELYHSCRLSGHDLLLEIIPPADMIKDNTTIVRAVSRLYELGIYPEWWKLESSPPEVWNELGKIIRRYDPYCRGIVILGLDAPLESFEKEFVGLRSQSIVKGFAIGRTVFKEPLNRYLRDRNELTAAQALVKYLTAQYTVSDGKEVPLFAGTFAIFGHGNVAGLGEALSAVKDIFPTYRAHNEQAMACSAIAYAKTLNRQRMMMCTTSIGPGATNMVTAAALASANRLPVLLVPGDVFATRAPDPVLQQVESFQDGTISANDCFRPVSRYFDRIERPEYLLTALPRALNVLTDMALCGPVTLAFPQDVQTMMYGYPEHFFEKNVRYCHRPAPDKVELEKAAALLRTSKKPFIVAGGGVHYADAVKELEKFASACAVPVSETQAGKSALSWEHPLNMGSIGVTGSSSANNLAKEADLIIAVGTRLQDFTTGSRSVFGNRDVPLIQINIQSYDAIKHGAVALTGDAKTILHSLNEYFQSPLSDSAWQKKATDERSQWLKTVESSTAIVNPDLPGDAEVIGVVNKLLHEDDIVVGAAGSLPGELHKLLKVKRPNAYHMEYGYSCMGYEIAGGIGVKMARPDREVIVMLGDGSYLMMNSEIAASVMLGTKMIIILLDNMGFGCINRLQAACGGQGYNNLLKDCIAPGGPHPVVQFAEHARALGANAEKINSLHDLPEAMLRARASQKTYLIEIKTDPMPSTKEGGCWWEVAIPEVSASPKVNAAHQDYLKNKKELQAK